MAVPRRRPTAKKRSARKTAGLCPSPPQLRPSALPHDAEEGDAVHQPGAESLLKLTGQESILLGSRGCGRLEGPRCAHWNSLSGRGGCRELPSWPSGPRRGTLLFKDAIRSIQIKQFEQFDRFEEQVPEDERSIAGSGGAIDYRKALLIRGYSYF